MYSWPCRRTHHFHSKDIASWWQVLEVIDVVSDNFIAANARLALSIFDLQVVQKEIFVLIEFDCGQVLTIS